MASQSHHRAVSNQDATCQAEDERCQIRSEVVGESLFVLRYHDLGEEFESQFANQERAATQFVWDRWKLLAPSRQQGGQVCFGCSPLDSGWPTPPRQQGQVCFHCYPWDSGWPTLPLRQPPSHLAPNLDYRNETRTVVCSPHPSV